MILLLATADIPIPDGYQTPVWIITASIAAKVFGIDKLFDFLRRKVIEPNLDSNRRIREKVAELELDNTVSLDYALYTIGFHYYFVIARQLVDIAISAAKNNKKAEFVSQDYFRSHISPDIQRTKRVLSKARLKNGASLDKHLVDFSACEVRLQEFYAPIVEVVLADSSAAVVRRVTLEQIDRIYEAAETFFLTALDKNK